MSSVVGLELPNAWRTGQTQDSNFDISADQLNVTANREMWIPSGSVNWGTALHENAADPVSAQDLATKSYVDLNGGNLWSTFPAQQDVDYVSLYKNINLIEPINPQDSATKNYVDTQGFATDLNELSDVTITAPANLEFLQFNSTSGQWENKIISVPAGNTITQGNSSVTVIDTGVGTVQTVIDGTLKITVGQSEMDVQIPILMNLQQIRNLGNPTSDTDASTKLYVDQQIATLPTDLNGLTDVTITSPLVNQILVNNGSGQFINQLITKSQLPSEIAYTDEANIFTVNNVFQEGLQVAPDKNLDMASGQILDTKFIDLEQQVSDPSDPALDDVRIFLDDGPTFGSPNPQIVALINRGGVIEKKPIPTSETIFALNSFSNGMFTNETSVRIVDNNPNIRVQIFNEAIVGDQFDVVIGGQILTIASPDVSVTVGNTIDLTEGTDISPVKHFVWIFDDNGTPTMTTNTVSFPTSGDFAVVGTFLFQTRVSVIADGAYNVNSPDYEIKDADIRGHLAHINDRLQEIDSAYVSGIDVTTVPLVGGGTLGNVTYTSTIGRAFELHLEGIEAFDITTGLGLVVNEGTQVTSEVIRVNDIGLDLIGLTCADGVTVIGTNQTINVVISTVHNDDEPNQTNYAINLPVSVYTGGARVADAIADLNNNAITTILQAFRGVALLIAEVVIDITTGPNFEVVAVKDLRGQIPGAASGSGGGGGGASQLNDLSDVTINTPLLNESLIFNGSGQWVNKLIPQFETVNIWTESQQYTPFGVGLGPSGIDGQFFTEVIDGSNTGLFVNLNQAGAITRLRLA